MCFHLPRSCVLISFLLSFFLCVCIPMRVCIHKSKAIASHVCTSISLGMCFLLCYWTYMCSALHLCLALHKNVCISFSVTATHTVVYFSVPGSRSLFMHMHPHLCMCLFPIHACISFPINREKQLFGHVYLYMSVGSYVCFAIHVHVCIPLHRQRQNNNFACMYEVAVTLYAFTSKHCHAWSLFLFTSLYLRMYLVVP